MRGLMYTHSHVRCVVYVWMDVLMYMYGCMYVRVCEFMCVSMYVHMYTRMYVLIYMYVCLYVYVCMLVCMNVYVCVYVGMY